MIGVSEKMLVLLTLSLKTFFIICRHGLLLCRLLVDRGGLTHLRRYINFRSPKLQEGLRFFFSDHETQKNTFKKKKQPKASETKMSKRRKLGCSGYIRDY